MTDANSEAMTACGGKIKNPESYPRAIYQGQQVYFCTKGCLRAFESNPQRFMADEIEHPLDDE